VCGGDFETTIKRSDFGMTYGLPVIPDNIKLEIQVEGVRQ
jgi:polyisoprenoid-binding protein YceI